MQAAQIDQYGGPENISVKQVTPPELKPGQVLVAVHTASLNAVDKKLHSGDFQKMAPLQFPITLGSDFSGVIQKVAADVENVKPGDEVYGLALVLGGGSGSLAHYAVTTASNIAQKPTKLTHEEAASLVVTGLAAIRAVEEFIKPHANQKVLIQGGTGGVGTVATQYLKKLGATVDATVQGEQAADFAKQLGANNAINVEQNEANIPQDYDVVLDTVGGKVYEESFSVVKKGGLLVTMSEMPNETLATQHEVSVVSVVQQKPSMTVTQALDHLSELIEKGLIQPHVDKVFPLNNAKDAFIYFEQQHPRGKVVVTCQK